jgi:pilus assembly protein CpaE
VLEENTANRRNVLQVVVAGSSAELRAQPVEVLAGLTEPEIEFIELDLDAAIHGEPAQVMMVVFGDDEEAPLALLQETSERAVRPTTFAVLPRRSPSLLRRALRAGADEILFLPLDADDASRALFKISEARRRNLRGGYGKVLSFVSMVGGVGTTTLAAHLALALRRLGKQVAVVDLDLQLGSLGVLLNIEPSRTIVDLADPQKKLDSIQLDLTLSRHSSGIALLAAPKLVEDSERVSEATVGPVLDLMGQLFDFVVVDCGTYINENVVAACDRSDQLFYVLDQSLESVRGAWKFMELLRRLGINAIEPKFILNRFVARHLISQERIEGTLTQSIFATVMRDDRNLERARWSGNDISKMAPRSPFVRSVEQLASSLALPAAERNGGLVSRLLSAVGARA